MTAAREMGADAEAAARRAIALVCVNMPHLSALAHAVRISADDRVVTAGVFASGRLLVNPSWFLEQNDAGRAFVLAHELLHLALRTHVRRGDADAAKFNVAHDLIINDMLEHELGMPPPGGGLRLPGARHRSVEELMLDATLPDAGHADTPMGAALRRKLPGLGLPAGAHDDMLDPSLEEQWYPGESAAVRARATEIITAAAAKSLAAQRIEQQTRKAHQGLHGHGRGDAAGGTSSYAEAMRVTYRPPWELAIHRWMDATTTPQRTYARASRRGGDVVRPGRHREGHTLSIVLDTSGSMTETLGHALGSIRAFGEGANIEAVRIVQCDVEVTVDEVVPLDELDRYRVSGFGGSDMGPAMLRLAEDPETAAAIVITDGLIGYPRNPVPYDVLWVVYHDVRTFAPPYGQVVFTHT